MTEEVILELPSKKKKKKALIALIKEKFLTLFQTQTLKHHKKKAFQLGQIDKNLHNSSSNQVIDYVAEKGTISTIILQINITLAVLAQKISSLKGYHIVLGLHTLFQESKKH